MLVKVTQATVKVTQATLKWTRQRLKVYDSHEVQAGVPDWQAALLQVQGPDSFHLVPLPSTEHPLLGALALADKEKIVHETVLKAVPVVARICPHSTDANLATWFTLHCRKVGNSAREQKISATEGST